MNPVCRIFIKRRTEAVNIGRTDQRPLINSQVVGDHHCRDPLFKTLGNQLQHPLFFPIINPDQLIFIFHPALDHFHKPHTVDQGLERAVHDSRNKQAFFCLCGFKMGNLKIAVAKTGGSSSKTVCNRQTDHVQAQDTGHSKMIVKGVIQFGGGEKGGSHPHLSFWNKRQGAAGKGCFYPFKGLVHEKYVSEDRDH